MKNLRLKLFCLTTLTLSTVLFSCSKHAEKVVGVYTGELEMNDTITFSNVSITLTESAKDQVKISSDYFETYQVTLDKKRYFSSKIYYAVESGEHIEVFDDGLMTLIHVNSADEEFHFHGNLE